MAKKLPWLDRLIIKISLGVNFSRGLPFACSSAKQIAREIMEAFKEVNAVLDTRQDAHGDQ